MEKNDHKTSKAQWDTDCLGLPTVSTAAMAAITYEFRDQRQEEFSRNKKRSMNMKMAITYELRDQINLIEKKEA